MSDKKNDSITKNDFSRNVGIDALRIVAMYSIVVLHIMKHGGILDNAKDSHFYAVWFIQSFVIAGVDCYALISGYVGYSDNENIGKTDYGKAFALWLQVLFYSVGFSCLAILIGGELLIKKLSKHLHPLLQISTGILHLMWVYLYLHRGLIDSLGD